MKDDGTVIIILNPPTHAVVAQTTKVGVTVQMPDGMTAEDASKLLRKAAQHLDDKP